MVSDDMLGKIFSAAAGVWTIACMVALALFKAWPLILGRLNERKRDIAEEKAGDWERLRAERDAAFTSRDKWHCRYTKCEAERNEWMRRAITAEAALQGMGEVRQLKAIAEAAKRLPAGNGNGDGGK